MENDKRTKLEWWLHDSNNKIGNVREFINLALNTMDEDPELAKEYLTKATMIATSAINLSKMFNSDVQDERSLTKIILYWMKNLSNMSAFNKTVVLNIEEDYQFQTFKDVVNFLVVLEELKTNAIKAGASEIIIAYSNKMFSVQNNGAPIKNVDAIWKEGFSTFGTTGRGLNFAKEICGWLHFDLTLGSGDPVRFDIKFN